MSEMIQKITDYNVNLELLLEQFKNSPRLKGLLQASNTSANDIETALFEVKENIYLSSAIGAQLDILGIIFNLPRMGMNDAEYLLKLQDTAARKFSGTPEQIMDILRSIYGATYVNYRPLYPAKFYIYTDANPAIFSGEINNFTVGGVGALREIRMVSGAGAFMVAGSGKFMTSVK